MRDINFFTPYIKAGQIVKKRLYHTLLFILVCTIFFLGTYTINNYRINKLNAEIKDVEMYLSKKEVMENTRLINANKGKVDLMKQYLDILTSLNITIDKKYIIDSSLFNDLSKLMPKDVFLFSIHVSTDELNIEGTAQNRTSIAEYEHNLKGLDYFRTVYVLDISEQKGESNYYMFTVKCLFKDVKNNESN